MKNYTAQFKEEALKISDEMGVKKSMWKARYSLWDTLNKRIKGLDPLGVDISRQMSYNRWSRGSGGLGGLPPSSVWKG